MHLTPDYFTVFTALKFNWLNSPVKWFSRLKQSLLIHFKNALSFLETSKKKSVDNMYVACLLNVRDSTGFIFTGFKSTWQCLVCIKGIHWRMIAKPPVFPFLHEFLF